MFENGRIIIWDYFLVSMFMRQKRYIFVSIHWKVYAYRHFTFYYYDVPTKTYNRISSFYYTNYKNTSIFSTISKIKFFVHLHFERYPYLINQLPKQSIDLWTGKLVKWTMIIAIIDPYTITTHCSLCWNLRSLSQRRK